VQVVEKLCEHVTSIRSTNPAAFEVFKSALSELRTSETLSDQMRTLCRTEGEKINRWSTLRAAWIGAVVTAPRPATVFAEAEAEAGAGAGAGAAAKPAAEPGLHP
jgi:hypothetical protein